MNNVQKMLKEICDEFNIKFTLVSKKWIIIMEKEDKIKYVVGYKFPLNDQACAKVCDDKYALFEVLNNFHIPVVEHFIISSDYKKEDVIKVCKKYNNDVVLKKNLGTCGNDVYHTHDVSEVFKIIDKLLIENLSISLCPYYDIKTEYRAIVFNGDIELVYGKKKPVVFGDGIKSIYELLLDFNRIYFENVICDNELAKTLKKNECYEYTWKFNLSKGAMPFLINEKHILENVSKIALDVVKVLGINFASIDVVELYDGSFMILEVNSGVMMDNLSLNLDNGREIAKDIYSKVIKEMFK